MEVLGVIAIAYLAIGLLLMESCLYFCKQEILAFPHPVALCLVFVFLWPIIFREMARRGG